LCGFGEVELFHVLSKARWQIAHEKVGLLNGFLWIDKVLSYFGCNDSIGESGRGWMCTPRRAAVGFSVVARKKMVKDMTGIGEKVCREGWPIFGKQGRNGLEGFEGFFPGFEPDIDLLLSVSKASVKSCIPSADTVLHHPHQSDGTAFSL
jgi:hypothetical protein